MYRETIFREYRRTVETIDKKHVKVTFFAPERAKVWWCISAGLDTVDLSGLNPASTQPRLVSTPTILLAQQHVNPALCPLCSLPVVTEDRSGRVSLTQYINLILSFLKRNNWINRIELINTTNVLSNVVDQYQLSRKRRSGKETFHCVLLSFCHTNYQSGLLV